MNPTFKIKYLEKYGLNEAPYTTNPDERFLFLTRSHKHAISLIEHTLELREGVCLIKGEAGTGKTTIMRRIASLLSSNKSFKIGVIENAGDVSTKYQLINEVLEAFGLTDKGKGKGKKARIDQLKVFLLDAYKENMVPVLLIDESQQFPASLLEELRGYLNIETSKQKLLQIILFAMPNINRKLPYAKSLANRLTITILEEMNETEVEDMLRWRFTQAGGNNFPFDQDSITLLYSITKGNPRLICGLAQLAIELASERDVKITTSVIDEVSKFKFIS